VIARKKRALGLLLGLLAAWPAVHLALVPALGIDPWRFGGFATYATTVPYQYVLIIELRGDAEVHLHNSWFSPETRQVYRDYRRRRATLGQLAAPHELAEAILAERPEIQALRIVALRDEISAVTSRSVGRPASAYLYRR
jgi:hypothetical protein